MAEKTPNLYCVGEGSYAGHIRGDVRQVVECKTCGLPVRHVIDRPTLELGNYPKRLDLVGCRLRTYLCTRRLAKKLKGWCELDLEPVAVVSALPWKWRRMPKFVCMRVKPVVLGADESRGVDPESKPCPDCGRRDRAYVPNRDEFDAERIENYRVFRKDWHGQRIFWLRYHPGGPDMDIVFTEEMLGVLKKCRMDEDQEIYPVAWA